MFEILFGCDFFMAMATNQVIWCWAIVASKFFEHIDLQQFRNLLFRVADRIGELWCWVWIVFYSKMSDQITILEVTHSTLLCIHLIRNNERSVWVLFLVMLHQIIVCTNLFAMVATEQCNGVKLERLAIRFVRYQPMIRHIIKCSTGPNRWFSIVQTMNTIESYPFKKLRLVNITCDKNSNKILVLQLSHLKWNWITKG